MRITEAIATLAAEYPLYSKSKLKTALKIEMQKTPDVETALNSARGVINNGALAAATPLMHADPTGNEAVARVDGTPDPIAYYYGISAMKGRKMSPGEIDEADKRAERDAAPIRELLGLP